MNLKNLQKFRERRSGDYLDVGEEWKITSVSIGWKKSAKKNSGRTSHTKGQKYHEDSNCTRQIVPRSPFGQQNDDGRAKSL